MAKQPEQEPPSTFKESVSAMVQEQKLVDDGSHRQKRLSFAYQLHRMLNDMESKHTSHIISWVGGGSGFKIHDPDMFEETIQQCYFQQSKIESFIRQVGHLGDTQEMSST